MRLSRVEEGGLVRRLRVEDIHHHLEADQVELDAGLHEAVRHHLDVEDVLR